MTINIKAIVLSISILSAGYTYSQPVNYAKALNVHDEADAFPFITGDGLSIYYESSRNSGDGSIFYSSRANTKSYFKAPVLLGQQFDAGCGSPTLTSDGLMIYVMNSKTKKLCTASRKSITDKFGALAEVTVLTKNTFYLPAISPNGKHLVATDYDNEYLVFFEMNNKKEFEFSYSFESREAIFKGARFSADGLQLYAVKKGGAKNGVDDLLVVFTRKTLTERFDTYKYVTTAKNQLITDVFASGTTDGKLIAVTHNTSNNWLNNNILVYETGKPLNSIDNNEPKKNETSGNKIASSKIVIPEPIKKQETIKKAEEPITFTGGQNFDEVAYVAPAINTSTPVYKKFTSPKGNIYVGYTVNGIPTGKGKCTFISGEIYDGDWKNSKREGKGKITYKSGDVYEGDWVNDLQTGKGTYAFNNGELYDGDWRNGKREGKGKSTYINGDVYFGDWKSSKREGKGKYTFKNGDVYFGDWINDKINGNGALTLLNGDVLTGNWVNDIIEGNVSYYTKATNTTKTEVYKNGKQVKAEKIYPGRDAALEATVETLHKSSESYFRNDINEQNLLQNFGNVKLYKTVLAIEGFKQVNIEKYPNDKTVLIAKSSLPEKEATALFNKLKEALYYYTMFIAGHNPKKEERRNGKLLQYRFEGSARGHITLLLESAPIDIEAPIGSAEKFEVTFSIEKR